MRRNGKPAKAVMWTLLRPPLMHAAAKTSAEVFFHLLNLNNLWLLSRLQGEMVPASRKILFV